MGQEGALEAFGVPCLGVSNSGLPVTEHDNTPDTG